MNLCRMKRMDTRQRGQLLRLEAIDAMTRDLKASGAERLAATRKLLGRRVLIADVHTHSTYSDGRSTVRENYDRARMIGIDFMFATDHDRIVQKRSARTLEHASWGQESTAGDYHLGLLNGTRVHHPGNDGLAADVASAEVIAPFVWIPHAAGFGERTTREIAKIVRDLSHIDNLAMEVLNGYRAIDRCFHRSGKGAVAAWDRLLCMGRKMTPVGASDTHSMVEIGNAWTGVYAPHRTAASIIRGLCEGRCFASEAPLLEFSCNRKPMGSQISVRKGTRLTFRFRAADAAGIAWARLISRGSVVKEYRARGDRVVDGSLVRKAGARPTYYRVEAAAVDDRRVFSSPIYVGES